jgi:phage major head subunit gpT-like protein
MLSIERVIEMIDDKSTTAEEAEELRDASRAIAEIIYQKWSGEQKAQVSQPNNNDDVQI